MSVLRIKNLREAPFVDGYDGTNYTIESESQAIVPAAAAKLWFGDWDARNDPSRAWRAREDEITRLKQRYGASDNPELWEEVKPLVSVSAVDSDEPFLTVIDDPSGDSIHGAEVSVNDHENMLEMIRQQSRELETLKSQYKNEVRAEQPIADADEDKPEPVASKRARRS